MFPLISVTNENVCYLDFSIDSNGECESIDDFLVGDEDCPRDYVRVNSFIKKLVEGVDGFNLSDHRTQVRVWWENDGTMEIRYRFFNEPDQGEFDDFELLNLPRIEC
jgi:hypothetical protein